MNYAEWFDIAPSILSAIATTAAAYAAFSALKVSQESKMIAERSTLAIQHGPATKTLTESIEALSKELSNLIKISSDVNSRWPQEIDRLDIRNAGGSNPRPLRHVLINASEMLKMHATENERTYSHTRRDIFYIIRNGLGESSDSEYKSLLKKADGTYFEAEQVFGKPLLDKPITLSPAFRWTCYQLDRRVTKKNWRKIWGQAWEENGYLKNYQNEYERILPILQKAFDSLKKEKELLAHSVYPLQTNKRLFDKYKQTVEVLECLLEGDGIDSLEHYIDSANDDEIIPLVIYSMGITLLKQRAIEVLLHGKE
ncbi:hypothetical protein [Microbulbifer sp. MCCC 1A16149]|uniref:hypothetical protein n=1 Tax=Microbulbifer sp. MCCC 1A16149 TaxID=3411322 RepID=UPI003D10E4CE